MRRCAQSTVSYSFWCCFLVVLVVSSGVASQPQERWLENNNNHHEDDGEHSAEHDFQSTFMVCIVLGLLLLTIAFEWLKETLQEVVSEQHERVIEKLFGEMTILGFLSMMTFVVSKVGLFRWVARLLFGDADDDEELLEVFETVHMSLFFIMVFFFLQVLVLIRQAMVNERQWIALDRETDEQNKSTSTTPSVRLQKLKERWAEMRYNNSFISLLPFFRNTQNESAVDRMYFRALRQEFLLDRDMEADFAPTHESQRLNDDFNFGRYLGLCLVQFLSRIVDVSRWTLAFFALASVVAYGYILLVQEQMMILAWTWLGLEWVVVLFQVFFEQHILTIRQQLVPANLMPAVIASMITPESSESSDGVVAKNEGKEFRNMDYYCQEEQHKDTQSSNSSSQLPGWCSVDLEQYMTRKRPVLARLLVGGIPNRQQTLFWMDRWGPELYMFMLQANLIFIGLDCAVQLLFFYPIVYEHQSTPVFVVYLIFSCLAILGSFLNKKHLIATLAVVCSVGCNKQFRLIEQVFREEKTENLIRAFLIVYRLRRMTQGKQWTSDWVIENSSDTMHDPKPYTEVLDAFEVSSVLKIFDGFDKGGDGLISRAEFAELLGIFGGEVNPASIQQLMSTLDGSGDGMVDREEFLQWYSDKSDEDDDILRSAPQQIFRLFDEHNTGELTIAQFKDKLDALRLGFTVDEQIAIVNELDRHGKGTIGKKEFECLFAKFNPKKLRKSERKIFLDMLSGCNELCGVQVNGMMA